VAYNGSKKPEDLDSWQKSVTMWCMSEKIRINSLEGDSYIQGFLKDEALTWFHENVTEDVVAVYRCIEENNESCLDPISPADIVLGLREHFISLTFTRDGRTDLIGSNNLCPINHATL